MVQFESGFCTNQLPVPANDGLPISGLVNEKLAQSLMARTEQGWGQGYTIDTQRSRNPGKFGEGRKQVGDIDHHIGAGSGFQNAVGREICRKTHEGGYPYASLLNLSLFTLQAPIGGKFIAGRVLGTAIVGLKNDEGMVGYRISRVAIAIGILQSGENITQMTVDARDHGGPMPGLIGKRIPEGQGAVVPVPSGQLGNFGKGGMRNLDGKQSEERLGRGQVVQGLLPNEFQGGEGINVIAVSGVGITGVVLPGRFFRIGLLSPPPGHRIGNEFHPALGAGCGRGTPEGGLIKGMSTNMVQLRHHVLVTVGCGKGLDVYDFGIVLTP